MVGTVKFFNSSKGFGWIIPDGGGDDIFVQYTGMSDPSQNLHEGNRVEFMVMQAKKGFMATNVKIISS